MPHGARLLFLPECKSLDWGDLTSPHRMKWGPPGKPGGGIPLGRSPQLAKPQIASEAGTSSVRRFMPVRLPAPALAGRAAWRVQLFAGGKA